MRVGAHGSRLNETPFNWAAPRFVPVDIEVSSSGVRLKAGRESARLSGALFKVDADGPIEPDWAVEKREFCILSLRLKAAEQTLVREISWFAGEWNSGCQRVISSTDLQDNVLFLRKGGVSFFLSLDFPCSRITPSGISYSPHDILPAGKPYVCHTISVGACRLSGIRVGELDRAEIEAVSAYVERRYPQRFERPVFISCCITNRLTECREGRIFYSMADNPTLFLNPKLLEEDIRLMAELGVQYFQVFEGVFDWPDEKKTGAALRRLMRLGKRLGVRIGDYVNPDVLYCPHYNYERRSLDRPEWRQKSAAGKAGSFCLGCEEYLEFVKSRLVAHNRKYGEELICMDFLRLQPCFATNHGHPPGDLYRQVRGLVSLMQSLADLSPNYLIWTNSGNWLQFMPKLTWFNPNVYLTDPHVRQYASTLNALKFLGDGRREQMVTVHDRHFVPWRNFTNCEYYAFPRSRMPDLRFFEYSFLQGLAVTPNICPAEVRPFLNRLPEAKRRQCIAFMRKWMEFVRANFGLWRHTARVGDAPGVGSAEIYAHIEGDRGFLCLVNQNPFPRTVTFRLDESIGLAAEGRYQLWEIHPRECLIAEQPLPWAGFGEAIACTLPPHSVRYLEVKPHKPNPGLVVYGHPASVKNGTVGYHLRLKAPQGEKVRLGLILPEGERIVSVVAEQPRTVPMYTFPVSAAILERKGNLAWLEVTLPRGRAPRDLTRWKVTPGDAEVELPRFGECGFLGALVHGAYSEECEVRISISTKPEGGGKRLRLLPVGYLLKERGGPVPNAMPSSEKQTFETVFELPFIEPPRFGCMPGYDDDTVIELVFADPARVAAIEARLNGEPVEVLRYRYPRKREWFTYYVELTGNVDPGTVRLAVDVEWRRESA